MIRIDSLECPVEVICRVVVLYARVVPMGHADATVAMVVVAVLNYADTGAQPLCRD